MDDWLYDVLVLCRECYDVTLAYNIRRTSCCVDGNVVVVVNLKESPRRLVFACCYSLLPRRPCKWWSLGVTVRVTFSSYHPFFCSGFKLKFHAERLSDNVGTRPECRIVLSSLFYFLRSGDFAWNVLQRHLHFFILFHRFFVCFLLCCCSLFFYQLFSINWIKY